MVKWASKWIEMRSQINRFLKFSGEASGQPPNERGDLTSSHTPLALAAFAARFKTSAFSAPPPATTSLGPALYRGITVTPIYLKIIEHIINARHNVIFQETKSKLQKRFTSECSSLNAALILSECI